MICFTWWGLTQYAARCIGAFAKVSKEPVVVVAVRSSQPYENLERLTNCPIYWLDDDSDAGEMLEEIPRVLFISNWSFPGWRPLEAKVRMAGGKVVAMSDANYALDLKTVLRAVRFRLKWHSRFDGVFVPGKSGRRLMRMFGFAEQKIVEGLYSADDSLFQTGPLLAQRPKRILYVGQFIERKNIIRLVQAFKCFHHAHPDWQLEMCGRGPLRDVIANESGVLVHDFVQPEELCKLYQMARAFILPSIEEHWGMVVHEAALSGCFLLLSDNVGAADDFLARDCGVRFNPYSIEQMVQAMSCLAQLTDEQLGKSYVAVMEQGRRISHLSFVAGVEKLIGV